MSRRNGERRSKSEAKRAAAEIRDLAEAAVAMPAAVWQPLVTDEGLADAIALAHRLSKNARRRQVSRVAALLRAQPDTVTALQAARAAADAGRREARNRQRELETLRAGLIAGDERVESTLRERLAADDWRALTALRRDYHGAVGDRERGRAYRALFRRLDALLGAR